VCRYNRVKIKHTYVAPGRKDDGEHYVHTD